MKKVTIKIDNDTEMLEIHTEENRLFVGNFSDFDRPGDIIRLLQQLGHETAVESYRYE